MVNFNNSLELVFKRWLHATPKAFCNKMAYYTFKAIWMACNYFFLHGAKILMNLKFWNSSNLCHNKSHALPYFWSQTIVFDHPHISWKITLGQLNKFATIQATWPTMVGTSKLFHTYNLYHWTLWIMYKYILHPSMSTINYRSINVINFF